MRPFHLAFSISDIEATRTFYGTVLGCKIGREGPGKWIDFDLFGHQLSAHLKPPQQSSSAAGSVDGDVVPIPHFGVILKMENFNKVVARLLNEPTTKWGMKPKSRFVGQPGEQSTFFVFDPSGNALEFKAFVDDKSIYAN